MRHAKPSPEDRLRSILHAAAEQVEPCADGLERIQARLTRPYPLPVAWATTTWTRLSLHLPVGFRELFDRVVLECRAVWERFVPEKARHAMAPRPQRYGWLRPVAAMATAVSVVAAVVYMAIGVTTGLTTTGNGSNSTQVNGGNKTGGQQGGGETQTQPSPSSLSPGYTPNASPSCPGTKPSPTRLPTLSSPPAS